MVREPIFPGDARWVYIEGFSLRLVVFSILPGFGAKDKP